MEESKKLALAVILTEEMEKDDMIDVFSQFFCGQNNVTDATAALTFVKDREKHFKSGSRLQMEDWIHRYLDEDFHRLYR